MPSSRASTLSALTLTAAVLFAATAATAATPASLKPASAYSTGGVVHGVSLNLVTSAASGRKIEKGEAAFGSQFALSGGVVNCPKAKKNSGFHEIPFAPYGLPAIGLKVSKGRYAFSKTVKQKDTSALGSTVAPFTMKLKITGTAVSSSLVTGTIRVSGGPCGMKKAATYSAKLDPKLPVAPGA